MRTSRLWKLTLLLAVLALVAAACTDSGGVPAECEDDPFGCVEVGEGEPIEVGTLLVITGPNAFLGQDSQDGVTLAADYLDGTFDQTNGEILGHTIAFNHQDDGCSADGGQAGAQSLASDTSVVAVIGTSCSSAAEGVADKILSDRGIALISPSNTAPSLTDPAIHQPFYLRTAHNDKLQGAAVANFAFGELGARTAATIHDGSPYADGLQAVFAEKFEEKGGEITVQDAIQVGDTDFTSVLATVAANPPDVLYFPVFVVEGGLMAQQAKQTAGLENTTLIGSDGMLSDGFLDAAGEAAVGVYLSGPDLSQFTGDAAFYEGAFKTAYAAQFGGQPTAAFHAHSYDATIMLFEAIEKVAIEDGDSLYIPRTALKDALFATQGLVGITGTLNCNADGDCQSTATIGVYQVETTANLPAVPVYSEVASLEG